MLIYGKLRQSPASSEPVCILENGAGTMREIAIKKIRRYLFFRGLGKLMYGQINRVFVLISEQFVFCFFFVPVPFIWLVDTSRRRPFITK